MPLLLQMTTRAVLLSLVPVMPLRQVSFHRVTMSPLPSVMTGYRSAVHQTALATVATVAPILLPDGPLSSFEEVAAAAGVSACGEAQKGSLLNADARRIN